MRIVRIMLAIFFFALMASIGDTKAAQAGDCACNGFGGGIAYRGCDSRSRYVRDPCHPSTRRLVPRHLGRFGGYGGYGGYGGIAYGGCRGHGTPWRLLRRGLVGRGSHEYRRWYVGQYFLHRYPFAVAEEEEARIDLLLAQADDPEEGTTLPPEAHLRRGMARFYVADYDGAQTDFDAVLAVAPKDARARFGRLFVALCRSDWKTAVRALNTLAQAGELKKDDRVVAKGSFSDPKVFDAVVQGLLGNAQYSITNGDTHLVAAWALAATDQTSKARSYLRLARRWKPSNAALPVLEQNLGMTQAPAKKKAPVKVTPESPVRAPREGKPLGRVVAQAKPLR